MGLVDKNRSPLADRALDPSQHQTVANLKQAGIPVVVILLTGRPVILGEILDQSESLVAAWLPGSEGQGVADVLFGDYQPTGKLSISWPRSVAQLPFGKTGPADHALFKFGYGLTYK